MTIVSTQMGLTGVERLRRLKSAYGHLGALDLLRTILNTEFVGSTAIASSFGAESAVLLHMVAQIDTATPILFLDTGQLFPETITYVDTLADRLGLRNVIKVVPEQPLLANSDPDGDLWITNPDRCCYVRKVRPFRQALRSYECWVSGLKRAHGGARGDVETLELEEGRIKVNPLARWTGAEIARSFADLDLPAHPLTRSGYRSIGCIPCTQRSGSSEDARGGRWSGTSKTECGIHANQYAQAQKDLLPGRSEDAVSPTRDDPGTLAPASGLGKETA